MRRLLIGLAIIVLAGLLLWVKIGIGPSGVKVDTVDAKIGTLKRSVLASGKLAYKEQVQMRSEVSARVQKVDVEEGDKVKKGQLLIQLDPRTYQAQVDAQTAYVSQSRIAIERQKSYLQTLRTQVARKVALHKKGLLDTDSFDTAKSDLALAEIDLQTREQALKQAEADLASARETLAKTRFVAPMNGEVTAVDVKEGETVIPGTTNIVGSSLMTLADTSAILTEVEVDEADIAGIKLGEDADVYAVAFPNTPLTGKVQFIATTARQAPGRQGMSFKVKILLDDIKGKDIRPGMSCRAEIYTQTANNALLVPIEAVRYNSDDKPFVMTDDNGTAKKVFVEVGISDDTQQMITKGLQTGAKIIRGPARQLRSLKDGDKVIANG
ncbi:efflux RND transporter periplasmic adaptor subunit [Gallaecimonas mangrovi]|uniref:efflux RND transporter periplasmic adaptor subunit n=1 Tax=Gallaecimonas mangrovi TaxID=2291597 RepID=UPI0018688919|nr:efflux RND transporter periplasmic adaptor subunit [Gallaecimonas mangrovi]